jgi:hypothetical protein
MHPIYSLDNTVNSFFETQPTVTRRHCDELAVALVGEPISPTPIQGAFSYTVIAGVKQSKIVQFRAQISLLDIATLSLARAIHGDGGLYMLRIYWATVAAFCIRDGQAARNYLY